ncbi:LysR family transcriptional regulator ArgP [Desulfopila aestuarii]|uniref:LysR family transcriptional regulator, chromosome initiation inhibitor n=1 Tax=Desulfopila aestuarii DSM 18488 TaxID=1121416 RepID=A0A1M7Y3V8_9BACT|nr:LysR family transcriptional regulator ArgP [Desulfopila aestuarii]SHO46682.1 LysR family transcriptional regulator, chromosome initiation inhibitor [Desulfopila aestuarii DSM 18488]
MLDYKLIEALALVSQGGGFDKAAHAMNITQSAVSQRVKLLEEQMGQILVARTSPPRLTSAGRYLLKHYLQVKRLEDDLLGEMALQSDNRYTPIAVALNADSLATWFLAAIQSFVKENGVLLDIRVDDQEQTHQLLKDGDAVGCISTKDQPLQGCRLDYLGQMNYHMYASPEFAKKWFPSGLTIADACSAPAIIFNRKDALHNKLFQLVFGQVPDSIPANYVPSSEKFVNFIEMGLGYGMLPRQQSEPFTRDGRLVDLAPDHNIPVKLYWHCWNLKSKLLVNFSRQLILGAIALLDE